MSKVWAVRAEGLSKKFGRTLRSAMKYGLADCGRRVAGMPARSDVLRKDEFWALDGIDFELQQGEALGIMGVNGSGKTTLLRILNGTFAPDRGRVRLRGNVGALIAAGAGFSPMLTGRENIYVNGALLGMKPKKLDGKLDEIIDFAQLEGFIDMPVRNYSSGMSVRLGFAIAVMSHPEVLLVDEVLAVGDLSFQKKCFEYMQLLKRNGTTIMLVSHAIGSIWAVCDRGLYLHQGKQEMCGDLESVCKCYDDHNSRKALSSERKGDYGQSCGGTGLVRCTSVRVLSLDENEVTELEFRQPFLIEYDIEVEERIEKPVFRANIDAIHYKFIIILDSYEQGFALESIEPGKYWLRQRCMTQSLRPGAYSIGTSITKRKLGAHLFYWLGSAHFLVRNPKDRFLYAEPHAVWYMDAQHELVRT
jgi:lipopolysaccharide transport system ATP-binding protein